MENATGSPFPSSHFETYLAEHWYEVDPILSLHGKSHPAILLERCGRDPQFSQRQVAMLD